MSQTEEEKTNPTPAAEQVERVRKVFIRDLTLQQKVHTVFRVAKKSRHLARSGKPFLALFLVDKTGEIPGRIFDNVETADAAFQENDFLLVKATVILFRGKPQLVIEQLERLAPEPIDANEFVPPPPPVVEKPLPAAKNKPPKTSKTNKAAATNLAQALETLCFALETFIQEKITERLAHLPTAMPPPPPSHSHSHAHSPSPSPSTSKPPPPPRAESKTDASPGRGLPKEFSFKPFDLLTAEEETSPPAAEETPPAPPEEAPSAPPAPPEETAPPAEAPEDQLST